MSLKLKGWCPDSQRGSCDYATLLQHTQRYLLDALLLEDGFHPATRTLMPVGAGQPCPCIDQAADEQRLADVTHAHLLNEFVLGHPVACGTPDAT